MAEFKTLAETRKYALANGTTVDLAAMVNDTKPAGYTKGETVDEFHVGQDVYVDALGGWRHGVVTKVAKTRVNVAVTTQAAIDKPSKVEADGTPLVRIQNAAYYPSDIRVDTGADEADAPAEADEFETPDAPEVDEAGSAPTEDVSGSAIVVALENVWDLIRKNHPDVPSVVLVTGAGIVAGLGSSRWGHFRKHGWETCTHEDAQESIVHGEVFIAGETLAEGGTKTVQTMLHEAAHVLAVARDLQDTSRQGRWHNGTFRKLAEELGLEYTHPQANKSIGFSAVTMTPGTADEYAEVIEELDTAIRLVIKAPSFMTGGTGGDQDGGENVHGGGRKPRDPNTKSTNNIKCVCECEEPNIIRMSRKVLDKMIVRCDDCEQRFAPVED